MSNDLETLEEGDVLPVLKETPQTREQLDALEDEVTGQSLDKMSEQEIMENIEAVNDETLAFLKDKMNDPNKEIADRAKVQYEVYAAILILMEAVREKILQKEFDAAEALVASFLNEQMQKMQAQGMNNVFIENALHEMQDFVNIYGQMVEQVELKERSAKMQLLSTGLDILPFVGGAKILAEGAAGKNLAGEALSLKNRALYMAEGTLWLTVDTVALGAGALTAPAGGSGGLLVEGAAMALKAPKAVKLVTRSAAVIRAAKGSGKGSRAIYNAGRFLVEHPELAAKADKLVARGVEARKAALLAAPGKVAELRDAGRHSKELIEAVNKERQELLETLGQLVDQNAEPRQAA